MQLAQMTRAFCIVLPQAWCWRQGLCISWSFVFSTHPQSAVLFVNSTLSFSSHGVRVLMPCSMQFLLDCYNIGHEYQPVQASLPQPPKPSTRSNKRTKTADDDHSNTAARDVVDPDFPASSILSLVNVIFSIGTEEEMAGLAGTNDIIKTAHSVLGHTPTPGKKQHVHETSKETEDDKAVVPAIDKEDEDMTGTAGGMMGTGDSLEDVPVEEMSAYMLFAHYHDRIQRDILKCSAASQPGAAGECRLFRLAALLMFASPTLCSFLLLCFVCKHHALTQQLCAAGGHHVTGNHFVTCQFTFILTDLITCNTITCILCVTSPAAALSKSKGFFLEITLLQHLAEELLARPGRSMKEVSFGLGRNPSDSSCSCAPVHTWTSHVIECCCDVLPKTYPFGTCWYDWVFLLDPCLVVGTKTISFACLHVQVNRRVSKTAVQQSFNIVELLTRQRFILQPDLTAALAFVYPATAVVVKSKLSQFRNCKASSSLPPLPELPDLPGTDTAVLTAAQQTLVDAEAASRPSGKCGAAGGLTQEESQARKAAAKVLTQKLLKGQPGPWSLASIRDTHVIKPASALNDTLDNLVLGKLKVPSLLQVTKGKTTTTTMYSR